MTYERLIASRMRLSGHGGGTATSIIMAISGIALAMAIMMAALCIVTGFKHEIRRKIMGFDAHVSILAASDATYTPEDSKTTSVLTFSPQLHDIIDGTGIFHDAELVMEHPAVIKTDSDFEGIVLRGLTPGPGTDFIKESIIDGSWPADSLENSIVISRITSEKLRLNRGDRVFTYFFTDEGIRTRRPQIAAIYDTHFSDYDKIYAYSLLN